MTRLLIVTAVEAERDAVCRLLSAKGDLLGWRGVSTADTSLGPVTVLAGGAGPAAAAAATSAALAFSEAAGVRFDLVLSMGIAGGFAVELGSIVCASRIVFADLGAETPADPATDSPAGFQSASDLGFGAQDYPVDAGLAAELASRTEATLGTVLTVATVTGTAHTSALRQARHPDALAEAMEGAGVAAAAGELAVPFGEIRAISNHVGPRDRASWKIPSALDALARAAQALTSTELELP